MTPYEIRLSLNGMDFYKCIALLPDGTTLEEIGVSIEPRYSPAPTPPPDAPPILAQG